MSEEQIIKTYQKCKTLPDLLNTQSPLLHIKTINTAETMCDSDRNTESTYANFGQLASEHDQILLLIQGRSYHEAKKQLLCLLSRVSDQEKFPNVNVASKSLYQSYVMSYNLAVVENKLKRIDSAESYLEQSMDYLETLIQNSRKNKEQHLIFTIEHIKLSLQHCVLLSQNGKHSMAAMSGSNCIARLIDCFKSMSVLAQQLMLVLLKKKKKRKNEGLIDFRSVILREAKDKLQFLGNIQPPQILVNESSEQLHTITNKLYTWKSNLENNERYIRQQLQLSNAEQKESRNILGIAKTPKWVEAFSMGSIMGLQPKYLEFQSSTDPYYILSENNLLELIMFTSAAFFTVSTEIRLRESEENVFMSDSMKYLKMNTNEYIMQCKILHLKAIELAGRFLPTSNQYISHLITSFNNNYKFFMEHISEEESVMPSTVLTKEEKKGRKSTRKRNMSSHREAKSKRRFSSNRNCFQNARQ